MVFYFTPRGCTPGKDDWLLYMVRGCHAAMRWVRRRWSRCCCRHRRLPRFCAPIRLLLFTPMAAGPGQVRERGPHQVLASACEPLRWMHALVVQHALPARLLSILPGAAWMARRNCIEGRRIALSIPT